MRTNRSTRRAGLGLAFAAVFVLAVLVPASPVEAGRAPGRAVAVAGIDGQPVAPAESDRISEELAGVGLALGEARVFASALDVESRALLGDRIEDAEVGGFHVAVGIFVACVLIAAIVLVCLEAAHATHWHWFHHCHRH